MKVKKIMDLQAEPVKSIPPLFPLFECPVDYLGLRRNTIIEKIIDNECFICESVKPPHCHHCKSCGRCVAYYDHHCPWINNCVGIYNKKSFILYNFYGSLFFIYSLLLQIPTLKSAMYTDFMSKDALSKGCTLLLITSFGCAVILIYKFLILFDQISSIIHH